MQDPIHIIVEVLQMITSLPFGYNSGLFHITNTLIVLDQLLKERKENLLFTARNNKSIESIGGTEIGNSLEFDFVVPPPPCVKVGLKLMKSSAVITQYTDNIKQSKDN